MRVFPVNDTPVQDLETEIPIEVRLAAQEEAIQSED